ncbi:MAG: DUF6261 family protein [Prevotellaceae bacterium]|jgi:hypothetical protein|nr:DUF6261 family protein [Prevotellaceae bacterium]
MKQLDKNEVLNALVKVTCQKLMNEMHLGFHLENQQIFENFSPSTLGIATFFGGYAKAIHDEDVAMEQTRKSADTSRISEADVQFDESYSGMWKYVQACLKHASMEARYAAENLEVIFAKYGNIGKQPYRAELTMSRNLLQDLRERPGDVQTIGLAIWMDAHEEKAVKLRELLDARAAEIAGRPNLRVIETRRETDMIYQRIISRLEAMININGVDYVEGFVAAYNTHATEYKNTLAQHLGRVQAGKVRPEEEATEE